MVIKKAITAGVISVFGLSLALGQQNGLEQQEPAQEEQDQQLENGEQEFGLQPERDQEQDRKLLSDLEEIEITGQDGQRLGEFEDVVVDMETGELTFIIVAGEDDQRRPVPIGALQVNGPPDAPELVVNISQQEWEQAPVIDRDEVEELGQEQRAREIHQYYGQEDENNEVEFGASTDREEMQENEQPQQPGAQPQEEEENEIEFGAREQEEESTVKLGRELKGARVQDQEGEEIGEISDLVLNMEEGRVSFVIIENGQQQYGVSPQSLQEEAEEEFVLNVTQQELEEAETLSREDIEQRAEELELAEAEEARESPQVFRFEQDPATVFGAPEREQEELPEEENDKNNDRNDY
jgi:sporulation protein YlmC with PRC-barrel domain